MLHACLGPCHLFFRRTPHGDELLMPACVGCSGELIRPGAQQVLHMLLQETFRMPVYREHCEWVHPLYEAHVRPTLVTFYNTTKSGMERADRYGGTQCLVIAVPQQPESCMVETARANLCLASKTAQAVDAINCPMLHHACLCVGQGRALCLQESSR